VPASSFPFPHFPDTGTGPQYPDRTIVGFLVQHPFTRASWDLTPLYAYDIALQHDQETLRLLVLALVFPRCPLYCLARRVPHAELGDFGPVVSAKYYQAEVVYQVQVVAVAQKRLVPITVHTPS